MKSAKKTRRRFSKEFKGEAIRQLELRGSRPVKEVAEALGVAENMLHAWRRELG
jgi:transposase-like protein